MKNTALVLTFLTLAAPGILIAQTSTPQPDPSLKYSSSTASGLSAVRPAKSSIRAVVAPKPFSRLALGGGVSAMGGNMQAAVNMNRHMNLRGTGNYLNYTLNNINVSGFNVVGKLNFATAGAGVDFYPFPSHGFRLSPGVLFRNQNNITANVNVVGGTKLSLNDIDYFSSTTRPITGTGSLGLHTQNPAFTMTTGWGNMIPRNGGHWSFPFEIGAAFVGTPAINIGLTGGQACDVNGQNCVNVATDPTVNANLKAQIDKYKKDLDPLKYYPILSFGVTYNFKVRGAQ